MSTRSHGSKRQAPIANGAAEASHSSGCAAVATALRSTRYTSFLVTCIVGLPLLSIAVFMIEPLDRPFIPNNPATSLAYAGSSTIPFAATFVVGIPLGLLVFAMELKCAPRAQSRRAVPLAVRIVVGLQYLLGYTEVVVVTGVFVEWGKVMFGHLRPDFQWRCIGIAWPDIAPMNATTCTGDATFVSDGRKGYPSGHTAMAVAVACYFSFYVLHFVTSRRQGMPVAARCGQELLFVLAGLAVLPLMFAFYVAASRIEDNRHDVGGVNAGIILGLLTAGLTLWRVLADTQRLLDTSGALSSRGSLVAMQRLSNAEDGDADADATAGDLRGTRH